MSSDVAIGIDLGGTKIYGARIDRSLVGADAVLDAVKTPTPRDGRDQIIDALVDVIGQLDDSPAAVGVGTPGVVADGVVAYAPNLAGFDAPVPLADVLADRLGCPVAVGNDVNMAVLGEARAGAAVGARDLIGYWLGTGVGGGLLLDGVLRTGPTGLAAEVGHAVVVPGGRVCGCGGAGHLEAYLGRRGLETEARRRVEAGATSALVDLAGDGVMKAKVFRKAWEQGDELARELLIEGFELLAIAIANVAVTVDVDTVLFGGGLGERFADVVVPLVGDRLSTLHFAGAVPQLRVASLGDPAGALGAAFSVDAA